MTRLDLDDLQRRVVVDALLNLEADIDAGSEPWREDDDEPGEYVNALNAVLREVEWS